MQSESSALVATNNGSCTPAYTGAALMSYAHNVSTLIVTTMMPAATKSLMQQKLDEENVAMAENYFGQVREYFGNKKSMHTAQTVKELKIINKSRGEF